MFSSSWIFINLIVEKQFPSIVLICIFLIRHKVEHLFICLRAICIYFFLLCGQPTKDLQIPSPRLSYVFCFAYSFCSTKGFFALFVVVFFPHFLFSQIYLLHSGYKGKNIPGKNETHLHTYRTIKTSTGKDKGRFT